MLREVIGLYRNKDAKEWYQRSVGLEEALRNLLAGIDRCRFHSLIPRGSDFPLWLHSLIAKEVDAANDALICREDVKAQLVEALEEVLEKWKAVGPVPRSTQQKVIAALAAAREEKDAL